MHIELRDPNDELDLTPAAAIRWLSLMPLALVQL
jgi:hypothetical protein